MTHSIYELTGGGPAEVNPTSRKGTPEEGREKMEEQIRREEIALARQEERPKERGDHHSQHWRSRLGEKKSYRMDSPWNSSTNRKDPQSPECRTRRGSYHREPKRKEFVPHKLGKMMNCSVIDTKTEKEWDDLLEDLLDRAAGFGADEEDVRRVILAFSTRRFRKQLAVVRGAESFDTWRHEVARKLFPFSLQQKELSKRLHHPVVQPSVELAISEASSLEDRWDLLVERYPGSSPLSVEQRKDFLFCSSPLAVQDKLSALRTDDMAVDELEDHLRFVQLRVDTGRMNRIGKVEVQVPEVAPVATSQADQGGRKAREPKGMCFGCGKVGHFRSTCPNIGEDRRCQTCGSKLHTQEVCRELRLGPVKARVLDTSRSTTVKYQKPTRLAKLKEQQQELLSEIRRLEEERETMNPKRVDIVEDCIEISDFRVQNIAITGAVGNGKGAGTLH